MKAHYLFLLLLFCTGTCWADFADSDFIMHPADPLSDPFVLEISGEWQTNCHPGEQKPVISEYTGDTVLIEFETIVQHASCYEITVPFRVLVDMSDVIDGSVPSSNSLETTIRFNGEEFKTTLTLVCICSPAPRGPDIKPESGLYDSWGLYKQGLLVARQNEKVAVYPLIYDDNGSSEWLYSAGEIDEDVFFSELYELTGGQCLGCAPPEDETQLNVVGKITMLMDSEGYTQVKVNDGLFVPYEQSEFGYGSPMLGGNPFETMTDLSGRWAFTGDFSPLLIGTPSLSIYFPEVFDVRLESVEFVPPNAVGVPPYKAPGHAVFSIWDTAGDQKAQMQCTFVSQHNAEYDYYYDAELVCDLTSDNYGNGELMYVVKAPSVERMTWGIPNSPPQGQPGFHPDYTAVRVD